MELKNLDDKKNIQNCTHYKRKKKILKLKLQPHGRSFEATETNYPKMYTQIVLQDAKASQNSIIVPQKCSKTSRERKLLLFYRIGGKQIGRSPDSNCDIMA